jgi:hypothetical protein
MATYPYRTVVDNAAVSTALVDAETVFAELGITSPTDAQTAQMETAIAQASALVTSYLDRVLAEEDVTDYFREARGDTLRLSRWPVTAVSQVIENGTELSSDGWELNGETGELWRIGSSGPYDWACAGTTTVSYTGGYILPDALPADIQRAVVDQVKAAYMGGARDPSLRSFQVPEVFQASYSVGGGDSFGKNSGLLLQVERALSSYHRVVV